MTPEESSLILAMICEESSLLLGMTWAKQFCDDAIFPNCLLIELIIFSLNPELFGQEEERRDEFTVCF